MSEKSFYENLQAIGIKKALDYVDKDPEVAIPKLISWARKLDKNESYEYQVSVVEEALADKNNNWYRMVMNGYNNIDHDVLKTILENFLVNGLLIWRNRREAVMEKYNVNIPWTILMDPTSACNLQCTGCWAADYGNRMNMSFETMDNIIEQAKEFGIHFFLFSGGEPLVRKDDIIRLCEKHNDCVFSAFTNGTLIDEAFADEMLRVKNFIPAFSIEGFEEANDSRRGDGVFHKVENAMRILREKKLPFGASLCYTRANTEVVGSEEFIDYLVDQGALFAWLFTYMPVGNDASPDLLVTADQRKYMYRQIRKFRKEKPIFTMDFWNDGEYVGGCIAGGRNYLHINANGDIEPCAFVHYSDSNIYEHTLLEAFQRPLFRQYAVNQPFNENHLQPCPLLDNPTRLAEMIDASGAKSTDLASPEDVHSLCAKCEHVAEHWDPVADELWEETVERRARDEKRKQEKREMASVRK